MFCNTFASSVSETRNKFASSCAAVAGRPNQHRNVFATRVLDRRNKMDSDFLSLQLHGAPQVLHRGFCLDGLGRGASDM